MGKPSLSETMTEEQFENGYWYATELRDFARQLGIPSAAKLRKDELERAVRHFLRTGEAGDLVKRAVGKPGTRDVDVGLAPDLPVRPTRATRRRRISSVSRRERSIRLSRRKPARDTC